MNVPAFALRHRPVVLALTCVFLAAGIVNFLTMSRREDPEITIRDALVVTSWPGASARRIEELITDPLEEVIVEIPEIQQVESKSMPGTSLIQVAADDRIDNVEQVWDDLRAKIGAIRTLPPEVPAPVVESDFGDVFEIVYALFEDGRGESTYTPRQLEQFAERIEEEIELLPTVGRVQFWGNKAERIYVEFDSSDAAKFDITANGLRDLFRARNIVLPGGEFETADARYSVEPSGEFTSLEEMEELIVSRRPGRAPVQLGQLPISITRRYEEPVRELTRITTPERAHVPAIVIAVSMKSGRNIATMDASVGRVIDRMRMTSLPPNISLIRVNDLPRQVQERIGSFQVNLFQGVLIVLVIALLMMGWRPALIMAGAVPLSMVGAFALVPSFGVALEQFSIASLIIALGMVVDNAVIVSDNAVRLMRNGVEKAQAVGRGAHELAVAMFTSTLTTMAAFLPMLTIVGNAGEYIASLPIVVATTLAMSFAVGMLVTPIMCEWLLRMPHRPRRTRHAPRWLRYETWIRACLKRPMLVVAAAAAAFLSSLAVLPVIGSQFFPAGERDQFFVQIWLPENASIERTSEVARQIEADLVELSPLNGSQRLRNAITYVGSGGPRLLLGQEPAFGYPYYALILINTTDAAYTSGYAAALRERVSKRLDARVTVRQFVLGPPIDDPVAIRLSGPDHDQVERAGMELLRAFKETPGTVQPFSNWGTGAGHLEIAIDSYAANLAGVTNADVAFTTSMLLSGAELTVFREGNHRVPVVLRTIRDKRGDLTDLSDVYVSGAFGKVPLGSIATVAPVSGRSVIARRNGIPTVTVSCDVESGILSNTVASMIRPKAEAIVESLPEGYFFEWGGELEETTDTQGQMIIAVGISVLLMVLVLTAQYNSLKKPLIVLFAVPMGMIGVLLGLLLTGWAMGFMAMLGLLALGGIVINNAIVLVDFIETNLSEGADLHEAVARAGQARMRPIVLTTLTTIGGLLPLSLFGGPLWAPMTNGMICGLIVSTVLTLFVIPSLYVVFVERFGMRAQPEGAKNTRPAANA